MPSWNDSAPKKAIVAFVEKVTKEGSSDFVPPNERIATFDNDGTLWAEQPYHDDAEREWAYDRKSHIGMLDKAMDEAVVQDWTAVSMKDDWKQIFVFENK